MLFAPELWNVESAKNFNADEPFTESWCPGLGATHQASLLIHNVEDYRKRTLRRCSALQALDGVWNSM